MTISTTATIEKALQLRPDPNRVRLLSTAVFPIVKVNNGTPICYIGTGFFISNYGLFATAKHVLMDVINEQTLPDATLSVCHFTSDGDFQLRPIYRFHINPVSDLAIGTLVQMTHVSTGAILENKSLSLASEISKPGDFVATFAYPTTTVMTSTNTVRIDSFSSEVCGTVQEYLPLGRDRCMLPGPCYRTSMKIVNGASGGPALSRNGKVIGVNSTGFDGSDISYITPISDLFRFTLTNVNVPWRASGTPISVNELAEHGIVRFE